MSSEMIINNLKSQLMIYQQMFEQLTSTSTSTFTPTSTSTPTSTFIPTSSTTKPKKGYIKVEEILQIFNITKAQYNNILVRINDILNLLF